MAEKQETILYVVLAFAIGVIFGAVGTKMSMPGSPQPTRAVGFPVQTQPQAQPPVASWDNIEALKQVVALDPGKREAWVSLGHAYFDSHQHQLAVEAYDKALAMDANDANVLTDQGVMYRRLGLYDKAIENFSKANQVDPNHSKSVLNLGIVYKNDLGDFEKAKIAWKKFLELQPTGPESDSIRQELIFLESHPPVKGIDKLR